MVKPSLSDLKKDVWLRTILRVTAFVLMGYHLWLGIAVSMSRFGEPPWTYRLMTISAIVIAISGIGMLFLNRLAWFVWLIALPVFSAAWFADTVTVGAQPAASTAGFLVFPLCFWIAIMTPKLRLHYM